MLHVCSCMLGTDAGSPMLIEIPSALLNLPCHHFMLQSHLAGGLMPFELHSRHGLQRHRVQKIMAEFDLTIGFAELLIEAQAVSNIVADSGAQYHMLWSFSAPEVPSQGTSNCPLVDFSRLHGMAGCGGHEHS